MPREAKEFKSGQLVQLRGTPGQLGLVIAVQADKKVRVEWEGEVQVHVVEPEKIERYLRPGEIE